MVTRQPNESQTRASLIDTQLSQAGWSSNRRTLIEEYALYSKEADPPYGSEQFADYVLLNSHLCEIIDGAIEFKESRISQSIRMIRDIEVLKFQRAHQLATLLLECA